MIFIKPLSSFWEKFPCFFDENSSTRERERERPEGGDVTYKRGFKTSLALDSEHPSCCLQNSISNNNCSNEY